MNEAKPTTLPEVYPMITSLKTYLSLVRRQRWIVLGLGVLLAFAVFGVSFIKNYTSSTIYRFKVSERGASFTSQVQLENILGKTETVRDKSFSYANSIPFHYELAKRLSSHSEAKKFLPVLLNSKNNVLQRLKIIFFDTFTYDDVVHTDQQVAQVFQKILSFKKDSDNTLIMFVRSGSIDFSIGLGNALGPIVQEILLDNESHDVNVSLKHVSGQYEQSRQRVEEINQDILNYLGKHQNSNISQKENNLVLMDLQKEIRMARIEAQRFDLLIKRIDQQIKENSTYSSGEENYKYVDQIAIDRSNELKQQKENATAKVQSLEKSFDKEKLVQKDVPVSEQVYQNLKWHHELETTINKGLILKVRELEGLKNLLDSSIRTIGQTTLVPTKFQVSIVIRIIGAFLVGVFASLIGIYYYYDFFKVVTGEGDLTKLNSFEIATAVPLLRGTRSMKLDFWREYPANHPAAQSFRNLLKYTEHAKIVSFISSQKKEGKSFLISNLSENLARFGKKVLVIDTNYINPTLSRTFKVDGPVRVINASTFQHSKETLIDRELFKKVIEESRKNFDVILIDTQPLDQSNDALIISSIVDCNFFVCAYLRTYHHKLFHSLRKIDSLDNKKFAFVLNKVNLMHEIYFFKANTYDVKDVQSKIIHLKKSS